MGKVQESWVKESYEAAKIPCKSFVRRRVSRRAYLEALRTEGPHVAEAEGETWWKEQERRYPGICAGGNRPEGTDSPNGSRNRHGVVRERYTVARGWERYERGRWVREGRRGQAPAVR